MVFTILFLHAITVLCFANASPYCAPAAPIAAGNDGWSIVLGSQTSPAVTNKKVFFSYHSNSLQLECENVVTASGCIINWDRTATGGGTGTVTFCSAMGLQLPPFQSPCDLKYFDCSGSATQCKSSLLTPREGYNNWIIKGDRYFYPYSITQGIDALHANRGWGIACFNIATMQECYLDDPTNVQKRYQYQAQISGAFAASAWNVATSDMSELATIGDFVYSVDPQMNLYCFDTKNLKPCNAQFNGMNDSPPGKPPFVGYDAGGAHVDDMPPYYSRTSTVDYVSTIDTMWSQYNDDRRLFIVMAYTKWATAAGVGTDLGLRILCWDVSTVTSAGGIGAPCTGWGATGTKEMKSLAGARLTGASSVGDFFFVPSSTPSNPTRFDYYCNLIIQSYKSARMCVKLSDGSSVVAANDPLKGFAGNGGASLTYTNWQSLDNEMIGRTYTDSLGNLRRIDSWIYAVSKADACSNEADAKIGKCGIFCFDVQNYTPANTINPYPCVIPGISTCYGDTTSLNPTTCPSSKYLGGYDPNNVRDYTQTEDASGCWWVTGHLNFIWNHDPVGASNTPCDFHAKGNDDYKQFAGSPQCIPATSALPGVDILSNDYPGDGGWNLDFSTLQLIPFGIPNDSTPKIVTNFPALAGGTSGVAPTFGGTCGSAAVVTAGGAGGCAGATPSTPYIRYTVANPVLCGNAVAVSYVVCTQSFAPVTLYAKLFISFDQVPLQINIFEDLYPAPLGSAQPNGIMNAGETLIAGPFSYQVNEIDCTTGNSLGLAPVTCNTNPCSMTALKDHCYQLINFVNIPTNWVASTSSNKIPAVVGVDINPPDGNLDQQTFNYGFKEPIRKVEFLAWLDMNQNGILDSPPELPFTQGTYSVNDCNTNALLSSGNVGAKIDLYYYTYQRPPNSNNYACEIITVNLASSTYRFTTPNVGLDTLDSDFIPATAGALTATFQIDGAQGPGTAYVGAGIIYSPMSFDVTVFNDMNADGTRSGSDTLPPDPITASLYQYPCPGGIAIPNSVGTLQSTNSPVSFNQGYTLPAWDTFGVQLCYYIIYTPTAKPVPWQPTIQVAGSPGFTSDMDSSFRLQLPYIPAGSTVNSFGAGFFVNANIAVTIFGDQKIANGLLDPGEPLLSGISITLTQQTAGCSYSVQDVSPITMSTGAAGIANFLVKPGRCWQVSVPLPPATPPYNYGPQLFAGPNPYNALDNTGTYTTGTVGEYITASDLFNVGGSLYQKVEVVVPFYNDNNPGYGQPGYGNDVRDPPEALISIPGVVSALTNGCVVAGGAVGSSPCSAAAQSAVPGYTSSAVTCYQIDPGTCATITTNVATVAPYYRLTSVSASDFQAGPADGGTITLKNIGVVLDLARVRIQVFNDVNLDGSFAATETFWNSPNVKFTLEGRDCSSNVVLVPSQTYGPGISGNIDLDLMVRLPNPNSATRICYYMQAQFPGIGGVAQVTPPFEVSPIGVSNNVDASGFYAMNSLVPMDPASAPVIFGIGGRQLSQLNIYIFDDENIRANNIRDAGEVSVVGAPVNIFEADCNTQGLGTLVLSYTTTAAASDYPRVFSMDPSKCYVVQVTRPSSSWLFSSAYSASATESTFIIPVQGNIAPFNEGLYLNTGSLTITAWLDQTCNPDGQRQSSEPRAQNILIEVLDPANGNAVVTSGTTDVNGVVVFPAVIVGTYNLRINIPAGWGATLYHNGPSGTWNDAVTTGGATMVNGVVIIPGGNVDVGVGLIQPYMFFILPTSFSIWDIYLAQRIEFCVSPVVGDVPLQIDVINSKGIVVKTIDQYWDSIGSTTSLRTSNTYTYWIPHNFIPGQHFLRGRFSSVQFDSAKFLVTVRH